MDSKEQAHQEGLKNIDRGVKFYLQLAGNPKQLNDQNDNGSIERLGLNNARLSVLEEAVNTKKKQIDALRSEIDALHYAYGQLATATKKVNWDTYYKELDVKQSAISNAELEISEVDSEIKHLKFANQMFHLEQEFRSGQNGGATIDYAAVERAVEDAKIAYTQRFYNPKPTSEPEPDFKSSTVRSIPSDKIDQAMQMFSTAPPPMTSLDLAVALKRVYGKPAMLVEGLFFYNRTISASAMVKLLLDALIFPDYKGQPDKMVAILFSVTSAGFTDNDIRLAIHGNYNITDREITRLIDKLLGREPITEKWQGVYYTECDYWGTYFSPLTITPEGKLLIGQTDVDYIYDERSGKLTIKAFKAGDSNASGEITFVLTNGKRSFNGILYPRTGDGAVGFRGKNEPVSRWQGVYQTGTDFWGDYFSPLIIKETGEVLIKDISISYGYEENNNKLIINRTPVGEAVPGGEVTFRMDNGRPVFHGVLFPQIGDGPGGYWGDIPVTKWKGEYHTGTDHWGAYFSPLVIREDGIILIKGVAISYKFDVKSDLLIINRTKIVDAVPSGQVSFMNSNGKPQFQGVLYPQIGDGPGGYWGHIGK